MDEYIEILLKSAKLLTDKGIKVSLYPNILLEIPDEILMIEEVFCIEDKDEVLENLREYINEHKVYPIAEVLGGNLIMIGCCSDNQGVIYYFDFDFGLFELDKKYDDFIRKLVDSKISFYD